MDFNHFLSSYFPDPAYGGRRLYADMVEGAGPPPYMVHGIGSRRASWDGLVPKLKEDFTCLTMD